VTDIRISRVHAPVTTLGPGRRLGIWFQGCSIGCAGCVSRDTWDDAGGQLMSTKDLFVWCREKVDDLALTGVTISGGEPFEQPHALAELLTWLKHQPSTRALDVLCYSGLPLRKIQQHFPEHLALIDALIPEPFVNSRMGGVIWRGSDNQPIVLLSELGRRRFQAAPASQPAMQVVVTDDRIWFVGVPRDGDLERLRRMTEDRGLALGNVSWVP